MTVLTNRVVTLAVYISMVLGAYAGTCTWIGTGTTNWGTESNWHGGLMPADDGSDEVIFANSEAVDITLNAAVKVKSLSVSTAKVTLRGSALTLIDGTVNVVSDVTFASYVDIKGTATTYPFVKIGAGTMEMRAKCNTFKNGEIREGTFKAYVYPGGDNVNLRDISIFDGATFAYGDNNCVANDTVFDVQKGGTLNFNSCKDFISGISGAGSILGGGGTAYFLLTRGSCFFSGTVESEFSIYFNVDSSTPEDARFVIGTATGCANLSIRVPSGTAKFSPFDRLAFSPGLGSAKLKSIPFCGEQNAIWPVDQNGDPVQLVGTSISFDSSTNTVNTIGVDGGELLLNDNAHLTITDGISTGTTFNVAKATSALTYAGGTAVNAKFTKSAVAGSLVLTGGETVNATWAVVAGSATAESMIIVSGGVHRVQNCFDMSGHQVLHQTGGEVTFTTGMNGYSQTTRSADIPIRISGGRLTHIANPSNHRGVGLDASGDAQVKFMADTSDVQVPRVASDGNSHTFRVRDNAYVEVGSRLALMFMGASGSATGTVDIAGGILSMAGIFWQPGTKEAFPSFLQFNGGTLRYYGLGADIINSHGATHTIQVGESPARVTLDVDNCDRKVTFNTPFSQNPTNTVADGGLIKDGSGTLILAGGATLSGPVEIKAGCLSTLGAPGSGSVTLWDATWCPTDAAGIVQIASVAGGKFVYAGASQLMPAGTTMGATYVIGPDDATSSSLVAANDSSVLFLRNKTSNTGIGSAYKVKVNGKSAGHEQDMVFAVQPDSANATGLLSFLDYDAENGYVPVAMTSFAEAGASDYAEVTTATTVSGAKTVRGLRLQKTNLSINSGVTLTVGDGVHPAAVLFNGTTSTSTPNKLSGEGTLAFGNSRGFLLPSAYGSAISYMGVVSVTIAGEKGIVFAALPDATSAIRVTGANTYGGGTWISGVRIFPAHAQCFGVSRDVYVTGNAAWGGELYFNSDAISELDYDLHLSGVGRPVSGIGEGAVRAAKNTTLTSTVELVGDTRISTSSESVTLTLSGDITGEGRLEACGLGMLKLSGTSTTWTGGARISGGTLAVTSAEALGSGEIEVSASGVLRFVNADDITVTNVIVGAGRIELQGPGSVRFTKVADFKGRMVMGDNGVLEVKGETMLPMLDHVGKITGSGTLILNTTDDSVEGIGCQIEGAIDVVKRGGGTFVLYGRNTYSGSTTVEEGTLTLDKGNFYSNLIATATVHLDATASDTITKDADGNVSSWCDADGGGIAFTNTSVSTQPVFMRGRINGHDALYFSRPFARLTANTTAVSNRTIFIVHRNRGGSRPSGMISEWANAGIYGTENSDSGVRFATGNTWSQNGWSFCNYSSIGCNGKVYNMTAVPVPTPTFISDVVTVSDFELSKLQTIRAVVGDYWHHDTYKRSYYGDIGEIIVFNRVLTAFEREIVRQVLSDKWGAVDVELATAKQLIDMAEVHLDASASETITADEEGNVSAWRDLIGDRNVFTNSAVEKQPVLRKQQINGLDTLFFGKGLAQLVSSESELLHQTVFVVHRNKSGARPSGMNSDWGCAGIYGQRGADCGLRFSKVDTWLDNGWGNYLAITCNGTFYDLTASPKPTVKFAADKATVSVLYFGTVASVRAAVGDYWNSTSYRRSYYGDVCEVIAFPRKLSNTQVARISQYLMEKWGVVEPSTSEEPAAEESTGGLSAETALTIAGGATCDLAGVSSTVKSLSGAGAVVSSGGNAMLTITEGGNFSGMFGAGLSLALGADAVWTLGTAGVAVVDLSGSGRIAGGPVTVSGMIRPGGAGKIGTLTLASAPVVTGVTLEIDVAPNAVDKLVVEEPFDLSPLTLCVPSFKGWNGTAYPIVMTSVRTGKFVSDNFTTKGSKYYTHYTLDEAWIKKRLGMAIIFR